MREFFRGWKRKAGVATLVAACVLMVGWVRSLYSLDGFLWDFKAFGIMIHSTDRVIGTTFGYNDRPFKWAFPEISSDEFRSLEEDSRQHVAWVWNIAGLRYGVNNMPLPRAYTGVIVIPYPMVTVPLTLLSAWMLLSKPRTAKTPEPSHSPEPDHA